MKSCFFVFISSAIFCCIVPAAYAQHFSNASSPEEQVFYQAWKSWIGVDPLSKSIRINRSTKGAGSNLFLWNRSVIGVFVSCSSSLSGTKYPLPSQHIFPLKTPIFAPSHNNSANIILTIYKDIHRHVLQCGLGYKNTTTPVISLPPNPFSGILYLPTLNIIARYFHKPDGQSISLLSYFDVGIILRDIPNGPDKNIDFGLNRGFYDGKSQNGIDKNAVIVSSEQLLQCNWLSYSTVYIGIITQQIKNQYLITPLIGIDIDLTDNMYLIFIYPTTIGVRAELLKDTTLSLSYRPKSLASLIYPILLKTPTEHKAIHNNTDLYIQSHKQAELEASLHYSVQNNTIALFINMYARYAIAPSIITKSTTSQYSTEVFLSQSWSCGFDLNIIG